MITKGQKTRQKMKDKTKDERQNTKDERQITQDKRQKV